MTVGILVMSIMPGAYNKIIFVPLLFLWVFFAFITSNESFINTFVRPSLKSYAIYLWLIVYILIYMTGYAVGIDIYLFNYMRIGFSILLFNYYIELKDINVIKRLTLISIALICFVCISTIIVLSTNPNAARILSTGREELAQNINGIVGSFGFIYSLVFICIVILGCFVEGIINKNKTLWIIIYSLFLITIFKASFMIALILLTGISLSVILRVKKFWHLLFLFLLIILFDVFCLPYISALLLFLANSVGSDAVAQRLHELNQFIISGNIENTSDMGIRLKYIIMSLESFISSPLVGVGGFYGYDTRYFGIGGHSGFLDELARYGILGTLSLFIGLIANMKYVFKILNKKQKNIYLKCSIGFFILGFINTIFFIHIFIVFFIVVPGLLIYFNGYNYE